MLREHALQQLREHIEGSCVSRRRVQEILGEKKYKALLKDKIRNVGWTLDNVYYWNVLDYMCMPEPPDEENRLEKMYIITKADGSEVDTNANYFVLRLDDGCKDKIHLRACRNAAIAYRDTVKGSYLTQIGDDLVDSFMNVRMKHERYTELMNHYHKAKLTKVEIAQGWHFCPHWDDLLIGPGMDELETCPCKREANNEQ